MVAPLPAFSGREEKDSTPRSLGRLLRAGRSANLRTGPGADRRRRRGAAQTYILADDALCGQRARPPGHDGFPRTAPLLAAAAARNAQAGDHGLADSRWRAARRLSR